MHLFLWYPVDAFANQWNWTVEDNRRVRCIMMLLYYDIIILDHGNPRFSFGSPIFSICQAYFRLVFNKPYYLGKKCLMNKLKEWLDNTICLPLPLQPIAFGLAFTFTLAVFGGDVALSLDSDLKMCFLLMMTMITKSLLKTFI